ncbi:MAG: FadR/GntR family transcriptional regulator [Candidatus Dormibacteraceae bacterium]
MSRLRPEAREALTFFYPIKTRRSFEQVIAQITEAIRSGQLQVGDRLPAERVLSARLDVSRPTLREAVKVLAETGVLEVRLGSAGGMFVKSGVVPKTLLEQRSQMRLTEVAEVLEARSLFELPVTRLAAVHATVDDLDQMALLILLHRSTPNDRARIGQYDLRFHLAIARATHNANLVAMMQMLQRDLELVRDMVVRDPFDHAWTITIHEATLKAIRRGDPRIIDEVMMEHLSLLERVWQEETGQQLRHNRRQAG